MTNIWLFRSKNLHMFTTAINYKEAKNLFKYLLFKHIIENPYPILDELIEITRLSKNGKYDPLNSHIEFTENWLRELDIKIDILNY